VKAALPRHFDPLPAPADADTDTASKPRSMLDPSSRAPQRYKKDWLKNIVRPKPTAEAVRLDKANRLNALPRASRKPGA
jgi:hypothetical protein